VRGKAVAFAAFESAVTGRGEVERVVSGRTEAAFLGVEVLFVAKSSTV
jgi:hypothetical protein